MTCLFVLNHNSVTKHRNARIFGTLVQNQFIIWVLLFFKNFNFKTRRGGKWQSSPKITCPSHNSTTKHHMMIFCGTLV